MKTRLQEAQQNAIWEMQNEFSVVTESQNDPIGNASHYTPLLSEDDVDSCYKNNFKVKGGPRAARFSSNQLAKSDDENDSGDDRSQMQEESNSDVIKS